MDLHFDLKLSPTRRGCHLSPSGSYRLTVASMFIWSTARQVVCIAYIGEPRPSPAPRTAWRVLAGYGFSMPHKIHSCGIAQILARVKCVSVCSSWIGVLKLFSQQGLGVLGNLQAFRSRQKASRTVKGASRPRPRPRITANAGPSGATTVGVEGN